MHAYLEIGRACADFRAIQLGLLNSVIPGKGFVTYCPGSADMYGDDQVLCPSEEEKQCKREVINHNVVSQWSEFIR